MQYINVSNTCICAIVEKFENNSELNADLYVIKPGLIKFARFRRELKRVELKQVAIFTSYLWPLQSALRHNISWTMNSPQKLRIVVFKTTQGNSQISFESKFVQKFLWFQIFFNSSV